MPGERLTFTETAAEVVTLPEAADGVALAQGGATTRTPAGTETYNLLALDKQRRRVKLLTGLEAKEQALYLEQAQERRLGIEDSPVAGNPPRETKWGESC